KDGPLFTGHSWGLAAADFVTDDDAVRRGFEPWVFYAPQNIRDEPLPKLLAAIQVGETLSLKISGPDGGVILLDAIYTGGFADALKEATEALADPALKHPIGQRCAQFANKPDDFWKTAKVSAAVRVCDPRSAEQRRRDEQR